MALLLAEKVTFPTKYSNFANVFLEKSPNVLPKQTGINKHAIKLEEGKHTSYRPIYSLRPVELKTVKTYTKTNLANVFICASKLLASASILFLHKCNSSFYLYVDSQGFNSLMTKN